MGIRTVKLFSQFKPVCAQLSDITDSQKKTMVT